MPRFSVVVPAYNASPTIAETLEAVCSQHFLDWECVIVDDGSVDATAQIAEAYCERDGRFRLVRQQNKGTAGAYQAGVLCATSDLLVICAADDLLLPEHLQSMDELARENPDHGIFSSNGEYLYQETGKRETVYTSQEWQEGRSLSFEQVVKICFYSVGAVYRRWVFDLVGGYRLGVYSEDYDFWLRAMAQGVQQRYTPRILSVHRVSGFQLSANLVKVYESNVEVYEHLLSDAPLQPEQRPFIDQAIARTRGMIADQGLVAVQQAEQAVLERQSLRLRQSVEHLVGTRRADATMRVIHSVSWIVRPMRRVAGKWRSR